jgi:hypothetical protein
MTYLRRVQVNFSQMQSSELCWTQEAQSVTHCLSVGKLWHYAQSQPHRVQHFAYGA